MVDYILTTGVDNQVYVIFVFHLCALAKGSSFEHL